MKIFNMLRKNLLKMGIGHSQEQYPLQSRTINVIVILVLIISIITSFLSIIFEYKNLNVAFGSFYVTMSGLLNIISYAYIVCQKAKLINLVDQLEETIQESKTDLNFICLMRKFFLFFRHLFSMCTTVTLIVFYCH